VGERLGWPEDESGAYRSVDKSGDGWGWQVDIADKPTGWTNRTDLSFPENGMGICKGCRATVVLQGLGWKELGRT
jgi:hypothetical protein